MLDITVHFGAGCVSLIPIITLLRGPPATSLQSLPLLCPVFPICLAPICHLLYPPSVPFLRNAQYIKTRI